MRWGLVNTLAALLALAPRATGTRRIAADLAACACRARSVAALAPESVDFDDAGKDEGDRAVTQRALQVGVVEGYHRFAVGRLAMKQDRQQRVARGARLDGRPPSRAAGMAVAAEGERECLHEAAG